MGIALFYITSCCITYMSAIYFGKILIEDIKANGHESRYLKRSEDSEEDSMCWLFKISITPIFNIIMTLIMIRITYSYHQYTLGKTDYNIFEEEGKF
jgi:hypothetical protein